MNASDLANNAYPSPTSFLGGGGSNTTITFTAPFPLELLVQIPPATNAGGITIGSVNFGSNPSVIGQVVVAMGKGQSMTISAANGSSFLASIRSIK